MRGILAVHPDHEYHAPIEKPETLKPLFAISLAPILYRHHRVIEDRLAAGEINPMLLDIGLTFRLVPGDHMLIVVTTPSLSSFLLLHYLSAVGRMPEGRWWITLIRRN